MDSGHEIGVDKILNWNGSFQKGNKNSRNVLVNGLKFGAKVVHF